MKKVLYSAMFDNEAYPFHVLAERVETVKLPSEMPERDSVLVLWGGADINPKYYNHKSSKTTYTSARRDPLEWDLLHHAITRGIPIIGVCRGAQMLCAAAGGYLIQDTTSHAGPRHMCTTFDGEEFVVNSIHHQMMAGLEGVDHQLLAWTSQNKSRHYLIQNDQVYTPPKNWVEPEMVDFPSIKGLAVQWHPEGMDNTSLATQFILKHYGERYGAT